MTHSQVPNVAYRYFRDHPLIDDGWCPLLNNRDHPIITSYYTPSTGWKRYTFRKRVSASWVRKMRAEGCEALQLTSRGVGADFTTKELLRR